MCIGLYSSSESNIVINVRMCYTLTLILLREKNSVRNELTDSINVSCLEYMESVSNLLCVLVMSLSISASLAK